MSEFHSTVSRRTFMKGLGLTGVGVGAASVTEPMFRDLDEAISSTGVNLHRPWWVKERPVDDPTLVVDWNKLNRRDLTGFPMWHKTPLWPFDQAAFEQKAEAWMKSYWPNYKGQDVRDRALGNALGAITLGVTIPVTTPSPFLGGIMWGAQTTPHAPTPQEQGIPVWQGTPEENMAMIRAAFSVVGLGPSIGVCELNEKTINFVLDKTFSGQKIVFEDKITEAYSTATPPTLHIPNSHKYVIYTNNIETTELLRRAPARMGMSSSGLSYARVAFAKSFMLEFMRGLGYHVFYDHMVQQATSFGIFSGVGEHARMSSVCVTPEYGAFPRTHAVFFTDLPLPTTNPIDAGIMRFCKTCGICATNCPVGAIPAREIQPNWEPFSGGVKADGTITQQQSWSNDKQAGGTELMWNTPGYEGWRCNSFLCGGCESCKGSCVFNTIKNGGFMHSIVKSTVATTPMFNSFFRDMEGSFHFGKQDKDPSSWWDQPNTWYMYGINPELLGQ